VAFPTIALSEQAAARQAPAGAGFVPGIARIHPESRLAAPLGQRHRAEETPGTSAIIFEKNAATAKIFLGIGLRIA